MWSSGHGAGGPGGHGLLAVIRTEPADPGQTAFWKVCYDRPFSGMSNSSSRNGLVNASQPQRAPLEMQTPCGGIRNVPATALIAARATTRCPRRAASFRNDRVVRSPASGAIGRVLEHQSHEYPIWVNSDWNKMSGLHRFKGCSLCKHAAVQSDRQPFRYNLAADNARSA